MSQNPIRFERRLNGVAVRAFRERDHKTQDQLATACGEDPATHKPLLTHTTISHIEAGRRQPSLEAMCRLADALKVHLDAITYVAAIYVADESTPPRGVLVTANGDAA